MGGDKIVLLDGAGANGGGAAATNGLLSMIPGKQHSFNSRSRHLLLGYGSECREPY